MKIGFGDNQFLGVSQSVGRGAEYFNRYADPQEIAATLKEAWSVGLRDFAFTVSDRTIAALDIVGDECPFNLHPALPYAQRINQLVLDEGLVGAITTKARRFGISKLVRAGVGAMFGKNRLGLSLLIRSELAGIDMARVRSVGLLNVATDFAAGSDRYDLLLDFCDIVEQDFGLTPCLYTMNFPAVAEVLWGRESRQCSLIFNLNSAGFRVNPSLNAVLDTVDKYSAHEAIAMSLFSGGAADGVLTILQQAPGLSGVLFGSSNPVNIRANYEMLKDR